MVAQVSNPTPRTIRVYCPTHKVGFLTAANSTIECSSQNHTLARDFPNESFWEYCCNCQHYWPMDSVRGNTASNECPVCERNIARRILCAHCKVVSVEADDRIKNKTYFISNGRVSPACPGCLRRAAGAVLEHTCEEFGGSFVTTHDVCPFCGENLEPPPGFPCLVADYVQKLPSSAVHVSFEANTGLLKETLYGECVLVPIRGESALSIVIPGATTLSSKQNYYNVYYELFNCENPSAGDVVILSPAVVETVPEGWQLKEAGFIEIKTSPAPARAQITCAHCGTVAGSKHTFCKRCGARLQSTPTADTSELETASAASSDDDFLDDTEEPAAKQSGETVTESSDWANKVQGVQTKTILGVVGGIVVIAIVLSLIAANATNGNSVEKRLDAAIMRRQLFSPSGDSAHDLYSQLKNSGAREETLSPYRDRLLPQLITPNYQMIDQFMVPGSDDPPLADWQTAYQALQWASELKPGDSKLASRLAYCEGRIAYLSRVEDQAINSWTRAAGADKGWPLPINGIGLIYTARKDHRTARTYYLTAAQRDPNWAYPYNNIGTSYYMEQDYSTAKTYYQKAVQMAPRWARPHSWLGDIALREKDYATAIREFSSVLDANATGTKNMELDKIKDKLELARRQQSATQY